MATFRIYWGNYKCPVPVAPTAGTHVSGTTEIQWVWQANADTIGYWWNSVNNFATAQDLGNVLTHTQTGLAEDTAYNSYLWAYNNCGVSTVTTLTATTLNTEVYLECDNKDLEIETIVRLLLIDCLDCEDKDNSLLSLIKNALVVDEEGNLYLKTNVTCGIRAGDSGLDQLGIRVWYGTEDTEYAACDQADSWESIVKRLFFIGDDGEYYMRVV